MSDKLLTVAITTYNRKQSLLETLRSFEIQGQFDKYKILVSNNCSDYDVNEWLSQNLGNDFLEIITIYNRPYNVGADINISFTFQLCETKWMWLMSDDDHALPDSISIVLNDIIQMPELAHIKYSIKGFGKLQDKLCENFEEVLDVFISPTVKSGPGQFVFMSNNVINLEKVKPYIGQAPFYAHTCITQLIPSIFSINIDKCLWMISHKELTNYEPNNSSYNVINAIINFTNIQLIDAGFNNIVILKLRKLFNQRGIRHLSKELTNIKPKIRSRLFFYRIWVGYYNPFSFNRVIFYLYFNLQAKFKL